MEWQAIDDAKAEAAFLQGLDLVPDHVDLLVAYGQLLTRKGNSMENWILGEEKLKRALDLEPNHMIAQKALRLLQTKRQGVMSSQSRKTKAVSKELTLNHSRSAYNDVLMEKSLAAGNGGYDLIGSDHEQEKSNDSSDRKRSHKKRERRRSKSSKKKKRRRRYSSSSSSSSLVESSTGDNNSLISADGENNDASDDSDYSRRRRRKKRKDKKRRKRHERKYHSKKKKRKRRKEEEDDDDNDDREDEDKKEEEREGNVAS